VAGPRGGDLGGAPRPAMSRPDRVANVGGTVERAAQAIAEAFAPGVAGVAADADRRSAAAVLGRERYLVRSWHAGPWADVMAAGALAVLGGG
jgi:hypothetical protein